mmetsp:Transcript_29201/g.83888  ORF Transcript_29201/g.83888 Transcript_29201/m.83888 type:complete len:111 (-) Transcript_29201:265-597(-)
MLKLETDWAAAPAQGMALANWQFETVILLGDDRGGRQRREMASVIDLSPHQTCSLHRKVLFTYGSRPDLGHNDEQHERGGQKEKPPSAGVELFHVPHAVVPAPVDTAEVV